MKREQPAPGETLARVPVVSVRGARQHNLKNIDLDFPRGRLSVITGVSGSGKSSLAFDTVYAEGQRRYVESVSTYAKQFLDRLQRPDVDSVTGLSPAVAIGQANPVKSARSTVGTATEIYDYLRLLFARLGETVCPWCERVVVADDPARLVREAESSWREGDEVWVLAPVEIPPRLPWKTMAEGLVANGFLRIRQGEEIVDLDPLPKLGRGAKEIELVVDRFRWGEGQSSRLAEALQTAFARGEGDLILVRNGASERRSERWVCPRDDLVFPRPEPILFSFNSPYGVCPTCRGFGDVLEFDESRIVPDPSRTLAGGAIDPWAGSWKRVYAKRLREVADREGIRLDVPWKKLPAKHRRLLLQGDDRFRGVIPFLERLQQKSYKAGNRFLIKRYQVPVRCGECDGSRLRPEARNIRLRGKTIVEVCAMPVERSLPWVQELATELTGERREGAEPILRELLSRMQYLMNVDLAYLTLDRLSRTLSGGEMQRIELANALGSNLVDTLYVLDEPTIGLHPRDTDRLLGVLESLAARGNTLLVVEHDPLLIRRADWLVDLGPGAGEHGGERLHCGPPDDSLDTPTGQYLSGALEIARLRRRGEPREWLRLEGVRHHNLENIDIRVPLRRLTCVTGVSGSGKSSLAEETLFRAVATRLGSPVVPDPGAHRKLAGGENLERAVLVDQSPIGKSPRSNPVTYVKAFDAIREVLSRQTESQRRGYRAGTFSFNVEGGRCEVCRGEGAVKIEMYFLADLYVPCEECGGTRYRSEVLEVRHRGRNVDEILGLTVDEAIAHFEGEAAVTGRLGILSRVGLGYLRLGQPATTLSGGESQRLKVARELAERNPARTFYLLDEPTVGLHAADVQVLLDVLSDLVERGGTVVLVEHHLDVIRNADWVVDLGPGGGENGGELVCEGSPETVARDESSVTGRYLREGDRKSVARRRPRRGASPTRSAIPSER